MAIDWSNTPQRELVAALRVPGDVWGKSGKFPKMFRLSKTDLIADIRALPDSHRFTWAIGGDPQSTGRYSPNRRYIIIWLGS